VDAFIPAVWQFTVDKSPRAGLLRLTSFRTKNSIGIRKRPTHLRGASRKVAGPAQKFGSHGESDTIGIGIVLPTYRQTMPLHYRIVRFGDAAVTLAALPIRLV
jgi:hypothetical protein